ncbi:hypothetical protein [Longimicrobium sp.]|uniref:hypothetical protein n=1 Tax=Longimicrobium sp. TaxID=2029185 RepID=UPI003B3A5006
MQLVGDLFPFRIQDQIHRPHSHRSGRYLPAGEPCKLKNSFESAGSCIAIVDPAQKFQMGETFGGGARMPAGIVLRIRLLE